MSNASLGLELEYFGFRVFLSAQGNQEEKIEEKDFKSKHIIVCDSEEGKKEEAKKLFSELGVYGIKVTLDSRSHQDYPSGEIPLTIELLKTVDIRSPKTGISVHFSYSLPMAMQIY